MIDSREKRAALPRCDYGEMLEVLSVFADCQDFRARMPEKGCMRHGWRYASGPYGIVTNIQKYLELLAFWKRNAGAGQRAFPWRPASHIFFRDIIHMIYVI